MHTISKSPNAYPLVMNPHGLGILSTGGCGPSAGDGEGEGEGRGEEVPVGAWT
jgi:hypothetical protein